MSTHTRLTRWARGTGVAALTLVAAAACASAPADQPGQAVAQIIVDNTESTVAGADVYLVPEVGERTRLGRVRLNEREFFQADVPVSDRFVLQAVVADDEITSPPFTLTGNDTVEWNLASNDVELGGDDTGENVGGGR